jgi:hypothetical protein
MGGIMEDSLKVTESSNGGLVVEWHPDDPRYKFLGGLTEEQVNAIIQESILRAIEEKDD